MLLLVALAFAAVIALSALALLETLSGNGPKILAALDGRSFLAQPVLMTRPVSVRIVSRRVSRPLTAQPQLRVAA